jgi:adenylate cyclase
MDNRPESDPAVTERWRKILVEGHWSPYRYLPSDPRCFVCRAPFAGIGGGVTRLRGVRPSAHNPHMCNVCDDKMPPGGAEVEIACLIADVRGSTTQAEQIGSQRFADLMNRFYGTAIDVLTPRKAFIDKLMGDQVIAAFLPGLVGANYRAAAALAAEDLMRAIGYRRGGQPWLTVAAAVHAGPAFVGKVGASGVYSLTALGDTVNTAARLQAMAAPGEILLSEAVYPSVASNYPGLEMRELELRGKAGMIRVHVLQPAERESTPATV